MDLKPETWNLKTGARVGDWFRDNPLLQPSRVGSRRPLSGVMLGALVLLYLGAAVWLASATPMRGRELLLVLSALYLLMVAAAIPGRGAAALSGPQQRETLEELMLTRLRPSQVVFGKLAAVLFPAAACLATLLPVLVMAMHASGLPREQAVPLLLILAVTPVPVAAVGLWLSISCRKSVVATAFAYVLTALVFGATLASAPVTPTEDNPWWHCSPVWQTLHYALGEPARAGTPEWAVYSAACIALAGFCLWRLARRVGSVGLTGVTTSPTGAPV